MDNGQRGVGFFVGILQGLGEGPLVRRILHQDFEQQVLSLRSFSLGAQWEWGTRGISGHTGRFRYF
jgi:hypothetical protein